MTYVVTRMGRRMMRPLAKSRFHDEDVAISISVGERLSALSFAERPSRRHVGDDRTTAGRRLTA